MEDGGLGTSVVCGHREGEVPGIETVSLSFNNFNLEITLLLEPLSRGPSSKEDAGADRGRENVPIKEEVHRLENRMLSQDLSCCRRKDLCLKLL